MTDYISREALIKSCKETLYAVNANDHPYDVAARVGKYFRRCVDEAPAADVVEVVRCRDCKSMGLHKCRKDNLWHDGDDYCSRGVRKEEKEK